MIPIEGGIQEENNILINFLVIPELNYIVDIRYGSVPMWIVVIDNNLSVNDLI